MTFGGERLKDGMTRREFLRKSGSVLSGMALGSLALPGTAEARTDRPNILLAIADDWSWPHDVSAAMRTLAPGHAFTVPENLFRKITDEERVDWQTRFSGTRT